MIGVSGDDQETAERFRASLELPYALVGDPKGAILEDWGVRIPLVGLARRVTFLVGRDRRIRHRYESNLDAGSHVTEACALVRKRPGR